MMQRHHAQQVAQTDRYETTQRNEHLAARQATERDTQQTLDTCAANRDERMKELAAYLERREHIEQLREWESEHCKTVDKSKPVVRRVKDSRGEYHLIEGRDRGVDRICNTTPPAEIRSTSARDLSVGQPPYRPEAMACRESDVASSPVAAKYWSEN